MSIINYSFLTIHRSLLTINYSLLIILCSFLLFFHSGCDKNPSGTQEPQYKCNWNGIDRLQYLQTIACPREFDALSGQPFMPTLSNVASVKIVFEISTKQLFFVSSSEYPLHFDFCKNELNYSNTHAVFNAEQYSDSPQRLYYLASINFYKDQNIYTLEFIPDDLISADGIKTTFLSVKNSVFFKDNLFFSLVSTRFTSIADSLTEIPAISKDRLYGEQIYQALNTGEAYGYLKKINSSNILSSYLTSHDILVTDGLPLDIPVIAGIITTEFQTPLSHINVLSHNRGTPNMALKNAWTDSLINHLRDKLVFLQVNSDTFIIHEANMTDAEKFWNSREPHQPVVLECHDDTSGLFDMDQLSHQSLHLVGAKAANFAELSKIYMGAEPLPVPENAFAIPFYYYKKHMENNKIDLYLDSLLNDSLVYQDYQYRITSLEKLRKKITDAPLDPAFVSEVENKIISKGTWRKMRFRSSTNAEDVKGFNGAGLYDSYTGDLDDPEKSVGKAIKKVFSSLWTVRGFDEREFFRIDQRSVAMGILVHRSFPDEKVNGVAITGNIYKPEIMAFTVNAQIGEISVVQPPPGTISDQFLFYLFSANAFNNPVIEYISTSNMNNGAPVMTEAEIVQLARWLEKIKSHFYYNVFNSSPGSYPLFSMDVEFKFDGEDRKLYIKQARPY